MNIKNFFGLFLSLFLFVLLNATKVDMSTDQITFLSLFLGIVYYWLCSELPLFVTGLIGVSFSVLLGLSSAKIIFANFGHPIIFLFLGGFIIAEAFQKVGLDRRFALYLLSRELIAKSFSRFLFTLLCLTAFFSMWISNTATTAMMLPLVLGILKSLKIKSKKMTSLVLISVAYASSIGGIATPVGSTPNIISLGMLEETINLHIGLLDWVFHALPISIFFLAALFTLIRIQLRKESVMIDTESIRNEYESLKPFSKAEFTTLIIFIITVIAWMLPSFMKLIFDSSVFKINPGAAVLFTSSFLFILGGEKKILSANAIKRIDWSSLLLFGCGLALGKLLFELGLAKMAGDQLTALIGEMPTFFIYLAAFSFVIFATELTSNTATATILIPIMISLSLSLELNPFYFSLGISLACSLAFMLPVATPPNAIVYGSGLVRKKDMFKYGFVLNIFFSISLAAFIYCYEIFL